MPNFPQHVLLRHCDNLEDFAIRDDKCSEEKCVHNLANNLLKNCTNLKIFTYSKSSKSKSLSVTIDDNFFGNGESLGKLEEIHLRGIDLKSSQLSTLFHNLINLKTLDLSRNNITTIKADDFPIHSDSRLTELHLENNPLKCTCDNRKEIKDLNKKIDPKNHGTVTYFLAEDPKDCECNGTKVTMKDFFDTDCADVSPCPPEKEPEPTSSSVFVTSSSFFGIVSLSLITFLLITILVTIFISERVRVWLYHNKFFSKFFRLEHEARNENSHGLDDDSLDGLGSYDAFISYSVKDGEFVERMKQVLENPSLPEH